MANPVISQIVVGGVTYDIRDKQGPDGALHLLGRTTSPVTDGGKEPPTIDGHVIPISDLKLGDVVLYNASGTNTTIQEYVWIHSPIPADDSYCWELLGDEGSYVLRGTYTTGVPSASTTITPTFTGTTATITLNGNIGAQDIPVSGTTASTITAIPFSTSYTPEGSISLGGTSTDSGHTFVGTTETISATFTPNGSVSASGNAASGHSFTGTSATIEVSTTDAVTAVADHSYRPAGSVSASGTAASGHGFTGTTSKVEVSSHGAYVTAVADHTYTPAGSVSKPNVTVTPNRVAIDPVEGGTGTAIASVAGEVLTIKDLPTTTFATNVTAALAAAPTFTGTKATLSHSITSSNVVSSGNFTPQGSVTGAHSFSGTTATLSHSVTKDTITLSTPYTPAGTITGAHSFTGSSTTASTSYQPKGDIMRSHSFKGTTATISFSQKLVAKLAAATISASGEYQPAGTVSSFNIAATNHTHSVDLNS